MSYPTKHYTLDLLSDYINCAIESEEEWEALRKFALDILDTYADRHPADPGLPHILAEDVAFLQCPRCAGEVAPGAMLYDPISGEPDTCRECDAEDDA